MSRMRLDWRKGRRGSQEQVQEAWCARALGLRIVLWQLGRSVGFTLAGEGDSVKVLNRE